MNSKTIEEAARRFWKHVQKGGADECWIWQASRTRNGYGQTCFDKCVHRVSFFIHGGVTTTSKPLVLHSCHNKLCVNPAHLRAGDYQDNADDRVKAGHQVTGEQSGRAKLTENQVKEIRRLYKPHFPPFEASEFSYNGLARRFGVDIALIHRIVSRKIWRHLP